MRSNLTKIYIVNLLSGLVFWYAIEKLFLLHIGVNPFGISINLIVMVVVSGILEIPSGVLADRWSRKYTLAIGSLALTISSILYGMSHALLSYLIATAIYAVYLSFTSGTMQALTFDTLKEVGLENLYAKHQGRSYAMFLLGIAISSPLGGYISSIYGYRTAYYLSAIISGATVLIILSMHEPFVHNENPPLKIYAHIAQSAHLLVKNKTLLYLASILIATGVLHTSIVEYAGLYYVAIGFGAIGTGWADGGKWLAGAVGQYLSSRLARYFLYLIPLFFLAFALFSSWHTPFGLIFFFLATSIYNVIQNETQTLVQNRLPSSLRATALSLITFGISALTVPIGLAFGAIAKSSNVYAAYQLYAFIGIAYGVGWLLMQRHFKIKPVPPVIASHSILP